ncbi:MAG: TrkA C-terminal domain-containing protein [Candidatus Tectomicrobia bacterium]
MIIGAVAQGADILIPGGDTVLRVHDRVIVFALSAAVPQAEKLFVG